MAQIRHSISIGAPRERVFPLIASGSGFARWWTTDVIEDYSTGIIEVGLFGHTTVYRLKPIRSSNPWAAEWVCETGQEWAGTRLLFELTETGGTTQLCFTHDNWKAEAEYVIDCMNVWWKVMQQLRSAAEGKDPGPFFSKERLKS